MVKPVVKNSWEGYKIRCPMSSNTDETLGHTPPLWSQNLVRPLTYIHTIHIAYITMTKLNTWYDVRPAWCVYFVGLATLLDERYAKSFQKRISSNRKRVTSCMTKIYRNADNSYLNISLLCKVQLFWEDHKNLALSSSRFWHY